MEYGLRRYEAVQRLLWFVFFIFCLGASYLTQSVPYSTPGNPQLRDIGHVKFWTGLQGTLMAPPKLSSPQANLPTTGKVQGKGQEAVDEKSSQTDPQVLGRIIQFLVWTALFFLIGRIIWLVLQNVGKFLLKVIMEEKIKGPGQVKAEYSTAPVPVSFFPRQLLLDEIRGFRFSFLFHPFWRLRLMLSGFQKSISSEELLEKERRIVDADWQILHGSWGPYRWMFWVLPFIALVQTGWFLLLQVQNVTTSQKEILDTVHSASNSLLPLIQGIGLVVFFKLVAGLLRRLEELYLSNLDSLLFDRLLSKLPFQSNDTLIILETLQRQFRELSIALKRIERTIHVEKKTGGQG